MRTPNYHLYITPKEQSEVLKALVDFKNRLISENRYTDAVDDVIVKISKAKYFISKQIIYQQRKKNLPCNKLFLYNPPYHKHIEARMLMVRKTAKQFYIRNTHYLMLAS